MTSASDELPAVDGEAVMRHTRDAARAAAASSRPEAWITLRALADVEQDAAEVATRLGNGDTLALAGTTLAVKDNIDVAGTRTTAAHPAFAVDPDESAMVVGKLAAAGAIVIGKTNLDQFATGLVGTRSPFGAVRNVIDPERISGGSSSGSAVAVALGEVDAGLGTDTAGSGRVPAALNAIIGLKPTRGLLSTTGVVPACRSIDCVSVFARSVATANAVLAEAAGPDPTDPWSRTAPLGSAIPGTGPLRIGVPHPDHLASLDEHARTAWAGAVRDLARLGPLVEIDLAPYFGAGDLLYGSALVAERWDAVGAFLDAHPEGADPTVAALIGAARDLPAHQYAADLDRVHRYASTFTPTWDAVDVVAVPTVGEAPTLAEVAADPIGVNRRLGRFTNGCNLLDLCAAAVPAGLRADGMPFGITFLAPAFADPVVATAAARLVGEPDPPLPAWTGATTIVVVGAHLRGQPLNGELVGRGARFLASVRTAPTYRLAALPTVPPKPGLSRAGPGQSGAAIAAELWRIPLDGFGDFVTGIPAPLGIGRVELDDGSWHPGFVCEGWALADAPDITAFGGWLAYLASRSGPGTNAPVAT